VKKSKESLAFYNVYEIIKYINVDNFDEKISASSSSA
jgi:hypothetical protein